MTDISADETNRPPDWAIQLAEEQSAKLLRGGEDAVQEAILEDAWQLVETVNETNWLSGLSSKDFVDLKERVREVCEPFGLWAIDTQLRSGVVFQLRPLNRPRLVPQLVEKEGQAVATNTEQNAVERLIERTLDEIDVFVFNGVDDDEGERLLGFLRPAVDHAIREAVRLQVPSWTATRLEHGVFSEPVEED